MAKELYTVKEAKKLIWNAKGRQVYVQFQANLPTVNEEGERDNKFFPGIASVKMGRVAAMEMLDDVYRNFEKRGARVALEVAEHTLHISLYAG